MNDEELLNRAADVVIHHIRQQLKEDNNKYISGKNIRVALINSFKFIERFYSSSEENSNIVMEAVKDCFENDYLNPNSSLLHDTIKHLLSALLVQINSK